MSWESSVSQVSVSVFTVVSVSEPTIAKKIK